jgi:hypothetical protein
MPGYVGWERRMKLGGQFDVHCVRVRQDIWMWEDNSHVRSNTLFDFCHQLPLLHPYHAPTRSPEPFVTQ